MAVPGSSYRQSRVGRVTTRHHFIASSVEKAPSVAFAPPAFGFAVGDELLALLIPQREAERLEARCQRQRGDLVEHRILVVRFFETKIRNSGPEVMHMMQTDAAGEPIEHLRQSEI